MGHQDGFVNKSLDAFAYQVFRRPVRIVCEFVIKEFLKKMAEQEVDGQNSMIKVLRHRLKTRRNRLILEEILNKAVSNNLKLFSPSDKVDIDRFTFLNVHHGKYSYILDTLDDNDYDSEYEIMPHLVFARSADDVLENRNQYETRDVRQRDPEES